MQRLQYIPSFYFSKFAQAVSNPYTALDAYRAGNIDENGNIVGNDGNIDPFEYFVIKLKKIFEQLPPGMTRYKLGNIIGTMQIFSEEAKMHGITKDEFNTLVESEILLKTNGLVSYIDLLEDMGTGTVAGSIGVPAEAPQTNKGNISGYDPVMSSSIMARSGPVNMFPSIEMFTVPKEEFKLFKTTKYYPKTTTGSYLKRFGHRNPELKVAVKDEETGEIYWLPTARKKSFVEEYYLQNLSILKESAVSDYQDSVTDKGKNVATLTNEEETLTVQNPNHVFGVTKKIIDQLAVPNLKPHASLELSTRLGGLIHGLYTGHLLQPNGTETQDLMLGAVGKIANKSSATTDRSLEKPGDYSQNIFKDASDIVVMDSATKTPKFVDAKMRYDAAIARGISKKLLNQFQQNPEIMSGIGSEKGQRRVRSQVFEPHFDSIKNEMAANVMRPMVFGINKRFGTRPSFHGAIISPQSNEENVKNWILTSKMGRHFPVIVGDESRLIRVQPKAEEARTHERMGPLVGVGDDFKSKLISHPNKFTVNKDALEHFKKLLGSHPESEPTTAIIQHHLEMSGLYDENGKHKHYVL